MLEAIQNLKSKIQNLTGGHYVIEEPETNPKKVYAIADRAMRDWIDNDCANTLAEGVKTK